MLLLILNGQVHKVNLFLTHFNVFLHALNSFTSNLFFFSFSDWNLATLLNKVDTAKQMNVLGLFGSEEPSWLPRACSVRKGGCLSKGSTPLTWRENYPNRIPQTNTYNQELSQQTYGVLISTRSHFVHLVGPPFPFPSPLAKKKKKKKAGLKACQPHSWCAPEEAPHIHFAVLVK